VCAIRTPPPSRGDAVTSWLDVDSVAEIANDRPQDGESPPADAEKINTCQVRVENGQVLLNPEPLEQGTFVEPARIAD
jgi:hypothetical protein